MNKATHIGSTLDDFLVEEGLLDTANALAIKRVLVWAIAQEMATKGLSKTVMAQAMNASLIDLEQLLNPDNTEITLQMMDRAAIALGKRLKIELVEAD
ncbi:XRE family transcriptional regulator [Spirulina major]|uniref:XRE family transcriptional regulator n=1 Tax=Spirulina major TaxID=270636 RepID=UPI00093535D5|nr:XRE family transcriptional regulator [Spirulina major]